MTYITSTYLLDCLPSSVIVINNPTAVRNATEKIFPINFYQFMPKTIISNDIMELKNFHFEHLQVKASCVCMIFLIMYKYTLLNQ